MLSRWGRLVYRRRVLALLSSGALLVLTLAALSQGGQLLTDQPPKGAESTRAIDLVTKELRGFSESNFFLALSHAPGGCARRRAPLGPGCRAAAAA